MYTLVDVMASTKASEDLALDTSILVLPSTFPLYRVCIDRKARVSTRETPYDTSMIQEICLVAYENARNREKEWSRMVTNL
jgi:hypothetical protein